MVYICSPLRGDYGQNIKHANRYCEIASELGVLPLAPHTIFTQYLNDTIPAQRRRGLDLGLALLEKCDELWVMGRQISEGMRGEIAQAQARGMPTYQIEYPLYRQEYPVSVDELPLLGLHSCQAGGVPNKPRPGDFLVIRHDYMRPAFRKSMDQIGIVDSPVEHGESWERVSLRNLRTDEVVLFDRAAILGFPTWEVLKNVQEQVATWNHAAPGHEEDMEEAMEP